MSWRKCQWNETRKKTSIALLQCNVQKPTGTDKLAAEWDTIPTLLQVLQVRFNGGFSNNWRR